MPLRPATYASVAVSDKPTAAIAQTMPRLGVSFANGTMTSGTLTLTAIYIPAATVTSMTYTSGTTALATGAHAWAALYDSSLALLGQSVDDTAPVWGVSVPKTFTLATPATVAAGWYYVGLLIAATTVPTVLGIAPATAIGNFAPAIRGLSTAGLAGTAPNPCATPLNGTHAFYCYVS